MSAFRKKPVVIEARLAERSLQPNDAAYCGDCGAEIAFDKGQYDECPEGAPCRLTAPTSSTKED
jgi:hypothetical protein